MGPNKLTAVKGKLHSVNDSPSVDWVGLKMWHKHGKLHRENGPAYIEQRSNVNLEREIWCKNGKMHRDDGPADIITLNDGIQKSWYKNGKLHRDNDLPAYIENCNDGVVQNWYKNGKTHRDNDLPAVIIDWNDGITKMWYKNGQLHRENGPAEIDPDGKQTWWLNGVRGKIKPVIVRR